MRTIQHQQDSINVKWESSGAIEYRLKWHGQFNLLHPKTLSREARYKIRKIMESLEIKSLRYGSGRSNIYCDDSIVVKTTTWTLLLRNIGDPKRILQDQRSHYKALSGIKLTFVKRVLYLINMFENSSD